MEKKKERKEAKDTKRANAKSDKSEYDSTLQSFLDLKQGNSKGYAELMLKAMNATDNIMAIKAGQDSDYVTKD